MRRGDDAERAFDLRPRGESVWVDVGHIRSLVSFGHDGKVSGWQAGVQPVAPQRTSA
jgi:hypothetical protein